MFVVDSKNWTGRIAVKDGVLRQNGYQREPAVAGCADSALAVGELLAAYVDAVKPVMCFVRDEPVEGWARDVMLCSTANVVDMLTSRPRLLGEAEVADIVARLRVGMTRKISGAAAPRRPRVAHRVPQVTPPPVTAPASRRRPTRTARFFVGLGIWFCFMMVLGALAGAFPAQVDALFTPAALAAGVVSWLLARRVLR